MTVTEADELIILDNELLPSFGYEQWCYLCDRIIPENEHVLDIAAGELCSSCVRKAADRLNYLNTYGETN